MQITVKSVKVLKSGKNDYGDWKLVKVYTDDGEYTTLADEANQIPGGSLINITNMDEDEKGKKFKKFEIITLGTTPPPAPSADMSKDDWEEKDRRKIASIEGQNALTNLTNLTIHGIKLEDCPALLQEALQSKIEGFLDSASTTAPPKAKAQEKKDPKKAAVATATNGRDLSLLKDLNAMCKAVHEDFKLQPADTLKKLGGNSWAEIKMTPAACYLQIQASQEEKPE